MRSRAGRERPWRGRRVLLLASTALVLVLGCGRVHVGPDPAVTEGRDVAEETEIPESGYHQMPDQTLPLVTVDIERRPPAPARGEGDAEGQAVPARDPDAD